MVWLPRLTAIVNGTLPCRRSAAAAWAASIRSCAALDVGNAPIWMFQVTAWDERSASGVLTRLAGSTFGAGVSEARAGLTVTMALGAGAGSGAGPGVGSGTAAAGEGGGAACRITNRLS